MAFENENTLTANSKTTKQKFKKQSSEQLAIFIRQLGMYQIDLIENVRAASVWQSFATAFSGIRSLKKSTNFLFCKIYGNHISENAERRFVFEIIECRG